MNTATVVILATMVSLFAAFAAGIARTQQQARQPSIKPAAPSHPRRRPF